MLDDIMVEITGFHPDDALRHAMRALWFGYSKEAFLAFIQRAKGLNMGAPEESLPTEIGTPFENTNYIPSEYDLRHPERAIEEINSRRICPSPFPLSSATEEEFEEFTFQCLSNPEFTPKLEEYMGLYLLV